MAARTLSSISRVMERMKKVLRRWWRVHIFHQGSPEVMGKSIELDIAGTGGDRKG